MPKIEKVVVKRFVEEETDAVSYEVQDGQDTFLADACTLEEAVQYGLEIAEANELADISIQVASEVA